MPEEAKLFRKELKYFREGRALDENMCPIPTPLQVEEEQIKNTRIEREQARINDNISKQPTAGHHDLDDFENEQDRGR